MTRASRRGDVDLALATLLEPRGAWGARFPRTEEPETMRILKVLSTAGLSLVLVLGMAPSTSSAGQPGQDEGQMRGDPGAMIAEKLNLTADQQTQVKAIFDATHTQAKAVMDDATLTPDARAAKMKELHEATMAKVKAILTPEQQQKFEEIQAQMAHGPGGGMAQRGPGMGMAAKLTQELNLTADQQTKVKAIFDAMHPQMEKIAGDDSLSKEDKEARMAEVRDDIHAQIKAILTPEQQQKFTKMIESMHHE